MTATELIMAGRRLCWSRSDQKAPEPTRAEFTVRCGGCGSELSWPRGRNLRRGKLHCPDCRRRLHLPAVQRAGCPICGCTVSRAVPPQSVTMQCGQCGGTFETSPPMASAVTRRSQRSLSRRRTDAVAFLVTLSAVMVFVLFCLITWIL